MYVNVYFLMVKLQENSSRPQKRSRLSRDDIKKKIIDT